MIAPIRPCRHPWVIPNRRHYSQSRPQQFAVPTQDRAVRHLSSSLSSSSQPRVPFLFSSSGGSIRGSCRSSSSNSNAQTRQAQEAAAQEAACIEYMQSQGIDKDLHKGVLKAFQSAYGRQSISVQDLKDFGTKGMQALAASVEADVAAKRKKKLKQQPDGTTPSGKNQPRPFKMIHFVIPHNHEEFDLKWKVGKSLLELGHGVKGEELLGHYLEGTCGGQMSCCTCHVYLDPETYRMLKEPEEAELDMLDLAYEPRETSRLGCQVVLEPDSPIFLDENHQVTVTIPAGVNDAWK